MIAAIVAIIAENFPWWIKIFALFGLMIAHIPEDLLPHLHWYSFEKLIAEKSPRQIFGAGMELLGGGLVLPIILSQVLGISFWWIMACVIASSLFDGLVAGHILTKKWKPSLATKVFAIINQFNKWAHWWKRYMDDKTLTFTSVTIEAVQTILLIGLLRFIAIR